MSGSVPPIDSVSGGSHGVVAGYAQMRALAGAYDKAAGRLGEMARLGPRTMADGELIQSSVLSPPTFQDVEVDVLLATTGFDGLTVRSVAIAADALLVEVTVSSFEASDAFARAVSEQVDHAIGRAAIPLLLVGGVVGVPLTVGVMQRIPGDQDIDPAALFGAFVHDHPALAQRLVNAGGGLVQSLLPGPMGLALAADSPTGQLTTNDAARLLAHGFGDRTDAVVRPVDGAEVDALLRRRPGSVADLVETLGRANALDADDPSMAGAIQIQQIGSGGQEKYVVYLPGTDNMNPAESGGRGARDMLTNLQLIGGVESSYANGITEAMREAGLGGKEVMFVGHSQGGMVASALAADPEFAREFDVKHVVTAGSPTEQVASLPAGTTALHLENRGDMVPLLDGGDNPDSPNRVTVRFDAGDTDVVANHSIEEMYVPGARAVDGSSDGSVRDAVEAMRASGFLGSSSEVERVMTYTVSRH